MEENMSYRTRISSEFSDKVTQWALFDWFYKNVLTGHTPRSKK